MADEYHELIQMTDVECGSDFAFPRSRQLASAIEKHSDYSIIKLHRNSDSSIEYIIVDVTLDKVPPKNPYGIKYRERLAFGVSSDPKKVVEVRALRKGFPTLLHQNQIVPGNAPSLCLYFEPPASVTRTWTPQNFLRRVQWWLEKAARDELHPADQPVEQLFFVSQYELVLPWNYSELLKDPKRVSRVILRRKRPDGRATLFLEREDDDNKGDGIRVECIEFNMPSVVHGVVEHNPVILGQLHDRLSERGLDLLAPIKERLASRVPTTGLPESSDQAHTLFLFHIPVCRVVGAEPESVHHRALIVDAGPLKLGEEIGAVFLHEKKYFNAQGLLGSGGKTEWRDRAVLAVEVLQENDAAAARRQSGIKEAGHASVLIGAGSLGSAMLNLWTRSGWGQWTVIDKDHIKPHNISRHTAYRQHIGELKANVAAGLHSAVMEDTEVIPVYGDASEITNEEISKPLKAAALAIDCSTTLEYPRYASAVDGLARHMSAFITPSGNAAVLLSEDSKRDIRLRSLEAQYYRALIEKDWGEQHLGGNLGTFWSGASCRDISTVLPYSKVMAQAGTLAEHIPLIAAKNDAVIRVWERDPSSGSVAVHSVEAYPEERMRFGEIDLFIDEGVKRQLRELRNGALPNETGGALLGYYDFNINAVVVVCGLPAPPDSKSSPGFFERGTAGLSEAVNEATARTAGVVGYVGEWHSHPPNHSANPSGDDLVQLLHLAFGMADDGLPALQLIVGEKDIQILQGRVAS